MARHAQPSELFRRTLELIHNRPPETSLLQIADKANVSLRFVQSLVYGGVTDAAVGRIEALYNALSDKPLFQQ